MMKYAHLADLHLGSWRDPKMRDLSTSAFLTAIDNCLSQNVDFILFAGDIFNTSLPSLDTLKIITKKLRELHEKNIPLYVIAGSHDFSPSGKTMIDVLENAGLLKNVCKGTINPETKQLQLHFTIDPKTGTKLTGLLGRKGLLDKIYYQNLEIDTLEAEPGYKIFLFHTTISELKPKHLEMLDSQPASFLPKHFNYYAGGHIHHPAKIEIPEYGILTYPGALFPNNFAELEKYSHGGYYLITVHHHQQETEWIPLPIIKHVPIIIDCQHKSPEVITFEIMNQLNQNIDNTLITIRLRGTLGQGRVSDLNFKDLFQQLYARGAYLILKNTSQLTSEEFEEIKMADAEPQHVEEIIIKEHLQQIKLFDFDTEFQLTRELLTTLNVNKREGETVTDFQQRVETDLNRLLTLQ